MLKTTAVFVTSACLLILSLGSGSKNEKDYKIRNWEFTWDVVSVGDVEVSIIKNSESVTQVQIHEGTDWMKFLPNDAAQIGEILGSTETMFKKLKGNIENKKSVKAGKCTVSFNYDPQSGFSVYIRKDGSFMGSSISLDRNEADGVAATLQDSPSMAAYLDKHIDP